MKYILMLAFLLTSLPGHAGLIKATGKVEEFSFATESSGWEESLRLVGVGSLGTCQVDSNGLVVFRFKRTEDYSRGYSMVLSAYMSNKSIEVRVNENDKDAAGACYIKMIYLK